jgi:hypothetical protein
MRASTESITVENREGGGKVARVLLSRLMELWIFMAIVVFFLIRVLGSHIAQTLLSGIARRPLP